MKKFMIQLNWFIQTIATFIIVDVLKLEIRLMFVIRSTTCEGDLFVSRCSNDFCRTLGHAHAFPDIREAIKMVNDMKLDVTKFEIVFYSLK